MPIPHTKYATRKRTLASGSAMKPKFIANKFTRFDVPSPIKSGRECTVPSARSTSAAPHVHSRCLQYCNLIHKSKSSKQIILRCREREMHLRISYNAHTHHTPHGRRTHARAHKTHIQFNRSGARMRPSATLPTRLPLGVSVCATVIVHSRCQVLHGSAARVCVCGVVAGVAAVIGPRNT